MHGFTQAAHKVVKKNQLLGNIVRIANYNLYNLRNNIQVLHVDQGLLSQVSSNHGKSKELPHTALMGLDMGDDTVEVIKREDFISQVLSDLGLHALTKTTAEIANLD